MTFEAEDGTALQGTYFPAAKENAPLLVLMHWARGWQMDWAPYATWFQNREPLPEGFTLPALPEGTSFAVFTFDFRGFEGGAQPASFDADGWLLDARAAVEFARSLPGVHSDRLATIGASIGGDGAADACGEGCLGALSLSPGGFLNVPYYDAVTKLSGKPTWCLAAEGDSRSAQSCRSAKSKTYQAIVYEGSAHGMDLFQEELDPAMPEVILDFLATVFEVPVR
jgi:dienelactone hydrolase